MFVDEWEVVQRGFRMYIIFKECDKFMDGVYGKCVFIGLFIFRILICLFWCMCYFNECVL